MIRMLTMSVKDKGICGNRQILYDCVADTSHNLSLRHQTHANRLLVKPSGNTYLCNTTTILTAALQRVL